MSEASDDEHRSERILAITNITIDVLRHESAVHTHAMPQIFVVRRGGLMCATDEGLWLAPQNTALWIPAGVAHSVSAAGYANGNTVLFDIEPERDVPARCCVLMAGPTLQTFVKDATRTMKSDQGYGTATPLIAEVMVAPRENLYLPMPQDTRARRIIAPMMAEPASRRPLEECAAREGMNAATVTRLMTRETGLGYGRWRQQLNVVLGMKMIAEGMLVQDVAAKLGYDSPGGFIKMFRNRVGKPPACYVRNLTKTPARPK